MARVREKLVTEERRHHRHIRRQSVTRFFSYSVSGLKNCAPTDSGILDPYHRLLIDPVTFVTREGWGIPDHIGGTNLAPNGKSNTGPVHADGLAMYFYPQNTSIIWSTPSESKKWVLPESWHDLSLYPDISVPLTVYGQ
jgi:hypothetical protein